VIDRMRFGMVTDFIDVGVSRTLRWPVFNVADSAVTVGLVAFFVLALVDWRRSTGTKGVQEEDQLRPQ
jgi:signal peptidase II